LLWQVGVYAFRLKSNVEGRQVGKNIYMSGRNVNIYLPEETYNKIKDLIEQRKVSKFVSEAIEEKLEKEKQPDKEELE